MNEKFPDTGHASRKDDQKDPNADKSLVERFGQGLKGAVETPTLGLLQIAGQDISAMRTKQDGGWAQSAGNMTGTALMFTAATAALKFVPGVGGKIASVATGAAFGFLNPTEGNQGMETRLANAALGGGLMAGMSYGTGALGRFGEATSAARRSILEAAESRSVASELAAGSKLMARMDGLVPKSELGKAFTVNLGLGSTYTQLDSKINRGEWAGLGETVTGGLVFGGIGAAAHGLGQLAKGRVSESSPQSNPETPGSAKSESPVRTSSETAPTKFTPAPVDEYTYWSHLKYDAGRTYKPIIDMGLSERRPDAIPLFVKNYSYLDANYASKIEEGIRSGKVHPGTEELWRGALENQQSVRAGIEGPLAAARAGDANALSAIERTNEVSARLTPEARAAGQRPSAYIGERLEDPATIRAFAWQRYEREGASALYDMGAARKVGMIHPGTENAWKSAEEELSAYRKDLAKSLAEREGLSYEAARDLPARPQSRLIAELQERADRAAQFDPMDRPGLGFVQQGLRSLANADERKALVDYTFKNYPAVAEGLFRQEVKAMTRNGSHYNYGWEGLIDQAAQAQAARAPLAEQELLAQLKEAALNRKDDHIALGLKTLTNPSEIKTLLNHYMDRYPDVASSNIQHLLEYDVVAPKTKSVWEEAFRERRQLQP